MAPPASRARSRSAGSAQARSPVPACRTPRTISVIQVAGIASANSFTLSGGYVTNGTPYQYQLYAYGPGSPNGPSFAAQSLVGNAGSDWDYRLQNAFVSPSGPVAPEPVPPSQPGMPAPQPEPPGVPSGTRLEVAPQVPSYLTIS